MTRSDPSLMIAGIQTFAWSSARSSGAILYFGLPLVHVFDEVSQMTSRPASSVV